MATDFAIETAPIPDDVPALDGVAYNPEYPGSTADAPYGFKKDGTPYTRKPKGTGGSKSAGGKRMPASETTARAAAGLLARLNSLVCIALATGNMPGTAAALAEGNEQFEQMAYEALLADPTLCRKILGAGATSGKAGLVMAYSMLTLSIVPAAKTEIQTRRAERIEQEEREYNGDMR